MESKEQGCVEEYQGFSSSERTGKRSDMAMRIVAKRGRERSGGFHLQYHFRQGEVKVFVFINSSVLTVFSLFPTTTMLHLLLPFIFGVKMRGESIT